MSEIADAIRALAVEVKALRKAVKKAATPWEVRQRRKSVRQPPFRGYIGTTKDDPKMVVGYEEPED